MKCRAFIRAAIALVATVVAVATAAPAAWSTHVAPASLATADNTPIHWKQVTAGQVKLDGKAPLTWAIYQPDKKKQSYLVLILLGHRYLALNLRTETVYNVFPTDLQKQGQDFESDPLTKEDRIVPSTDWTDKDVGPEERIQLTLCDYGRILEINLPHTLYLY
jgi:hypothetical protein